MTRVTWDEERAVTTETLGDGPPVLFAHGAGAGRSHEWMKGMRDRLVERGFRVTTFDYPYMDEGRKAPDRAPRLLACHRAVYQWVASNERTAPFLVGKSMGGRMGSHLEVATPGLVFYGYPLVSPGKKIPRDVSHLEGSSAPMLFVQGARDPLGPLELIEPLVASLDDARLEVVPDANHSFKVPKRTGITPDEMLDRLADLGGQWMRQAGGGT